MILFRNLSPTQIKWYPLPILFFIPPTTLIFDRNRPNAISTINYTSPVLPIPPPPTHTHMHTHFPQQWHSLYDISQVTHHKTPSFCNLTFRNLLEKINFVKPFSSLKIFKNSTSNFHYFIRYRKKNVHNVLYTK